MAAVMTTRSFELDRPETGTPRRLELVQPATARPPRGGSRPVRHSPAVLRRRRIVTVVLALGFVVVAARAGSALGGSPLTAPGRRPTIEHVVVRPGDSLWTIAQRIAPGQDPRPIVDELSAARHGAPLVAGETIDWQK
jgi:hypothetical protein